MTIAELCENIGFTSNHIVNALKSFEKTLGELKTENATLKTKNANYGQKIKELEDTIEEYRKNSFDKDDFGALSDELNKVDEENKRLSGELNKIVEENNRLKEENEKIKEKWKVDHDQLVILRRMWENHTEDSSKHLHQITDEDRQKSEKKRKDNSRRVAMSLWGTIEHYLTIVVGQTGSVTDKTKVDMQVIKTNSRLSESRIRQMTTKDPWFNAMKQYCYQKGWQHLADWINYGCKYENVDKKI